MSGKYAIGLDFGTNSVRALLVDVQTGEEIATTVWGFPHGDAGILLDAKDPNLARQHPRDYVAGIERVLQDTLEQARAYAGFTPADVVGIGVDTTGSTPIPVDASGTPLAFQPEFENDLAAMAWLWKDHTSIEEAEAFTNLARELRPEYLLKCGGTYSSEWFWSKTLHCLRTSPKVFAAAHTWVECADWIPAVLTGTTPPSRVKRCVCAAGHKASYHPSWGGYPDAAFLAKLDPGLARLRETLPDKCFTIADTAGGLTAEWAAKTGLSAGIPVAVGAFDAHLGGVGSGIQPGVLVRALGTSSCDLAVSPLGQPMPDIPGLCGIVPESILPGHYGLEAGQSAVGDIFNWFVNYMQPGGPEKGSHEALTRGAAALKPGESGLLALDWHNGNRTVLVDPRLTGGVIGLTLHTRAEEIYRALMEATAFGARIILERFAEYGVKIERVINCGGIPVKNPLVMQIYADVMNRTMEVSRSEQTCALGAAMAGAVVAGPAAGGHADFAEAAGAMTAVRDKKYAPDAKNHKVYERLFAQYKKLHDSLGTRAYAENLFGVMKELLVLREETR
ncbi:MAG: ribulokinase [Candidatus Hydrogenedentes bacterium]|nr:ribulokinase [Candidatus Hydrogenedentota bacterium]